MIVLFSFGAKNLSDLSMPNVIPVYFVVSD